MKPRMSGTGCNYPCISKLQLCSTPVSTYAIVHADIYDIHISLKRWPSDKFKENFETYLKVHVMQLSLNKVYRFMASPE